MPAHNRVQFFVMVVRVGQDIRFAGHGDAPGETLARANPKILVWIRAKSNGCFHFQTFGLGVAQQDHPQLRSKGGGGDLQNAFEQGRQIGRRQLRIQADSRAAEARRCASK